jgi:hypothetical protein
MNLIHFLHIDESDYFTITTWFTIVLLKCFTEKTYSPADHDEQSIVKESSGLVS